MGKKGTQPIERAILRVLHDHSDARPEGVHGYELARLLIETSGRPNSGPALTDPRVSGSIYKALHRLARCGALASHWEEPEPALEARRPRRRYYRLTENGLARARNLERAWTFARRYRKARPRWIEPSRWDPPPVRPPAGQRLTPRG